METETTVLGFRVLAISLFVVALLLWWKLPKGTSPRDVLRIMFTSALAAVASTEWGLRNLGALLAVMLFVGVVDLIATWTIRINRRSKREP